ncbi:MAG: hypothetical protein ACI906_002003, partial [Candidatus Latescibacterota bacterium]
MLNKLSGFVVTAREHMRIDTKKPALRPIFYKMLTPQPALQPSGCFFAA